MQIMNNQLMNIKITIKNLESNEETLKYNIIKLLDEYPQYKLNIYLYFQNFHNFNYCLYKHKLRMNNLEYEENQYIISFD